MILAGGVREMKAERVEGGVRSSIVFLRNHVARMDAVRDA
jgi:hypothetical protein